MCLSGKLNTKMRIVVTQVCTCLFSLFEACVKGHCELTFLSIHRSDSFRPTYARLHELHALVPSGVPLLAATATVTRSIRDDIIDKLDMGGCEVICVSPNRPNIYYEVRPRTTVEADMKHLVTCLRMRGSKADRVIVYCRTLDMCADLYEHFHNSLGEMSYYPVKSVITASLACITPIHPHTIRK